MHTAQYKIDPKQLGTTSAASCCNAFAVATFSSLVGLVCTVCDVKTVRQCPL